MQIVYFISTFSGNKGVGGHYHSLDQISREIGKDHTVAIFSIGAKPSPVLEINPYFEEHIEIKSGWRSIKMLNALLAKLYILGDRELIVHAFDTDSLLRLLPCRSLSNLGLVWNKCGGPNPKGNTYLYADEIVVFSKENEEWFIDNANYLNERIHLIPNRVRALKYMPKPKRTMQKSEKKISFMRISRLGGAYDRTLRNTFSMIANLAKSFPVELLVVGRIQNMEKFTILRSEAKALGVNVLFITDERASKAAQFLYLADFVIGTGRSFMEAASLGIPAFAPAENSDWPILVTTKNFKYFFARNFSERATVPDNIILENKNKITRVLTSMPERRAAGQEMQRLFSTFFGTEQIAENYGSVYEKAIKFPQTYWQRLWRNKYYLIKYYLLGNK